ncbi:MAG TPA: carboxypeptidase-like regulatory domain-containing protein [Pyrinomonadaceae bacterium]|nr:carboxypeptidase-like regulatory domain-containing protein [Pyrinomonadaceae bacterium]
MNIKFLKQIAFLASLLVFVSAVAFGQSTGGVKGKVRTARGAGIGEATVTARQKGQDVKTVSTDSKGEFVLDGLESGSYNFVFTKTGYGAGTLYNVEVKKNKISELPDRLILTIDQGTQVIVRGSVFNQDGVSLYGVKVEIERINEGGAAKKVGSEYTSRAGEFTFRFPEGAAKFRITASAKGVSASKEVTVDNAAVYRLAITLDLSKAN